MGQIIPAGEKAYDFFISYKSENIDVVRPIAEILIASHFNVWFSEYTLDLNTYLDPDHALREAISAGISKSKFGLCFTNEAYLASDWCRTELNGFFEYLNPDCMIQILLPVPASYTSITLSKTEIDEIGGLKEKLRPLSNIQFQSIAATLREIENITKFEIHVPVQESGTETSSPSKRTHFVYNHNDFSLDFSGWRVHKRWAFVTGNGDLPGPKFERKFPEGLVSGHVLIGPQDKNTTRALSTQYNSRKAAPDRLYYHKAAEFAQVVIHGLWNRAFGNLRGQAVYGTHLFFLLGHNQMAVTTFSGKREAVPFGKGGTFNRLYSIVVSETSDDPDTEIAFFFSFQGSFPAFCQCSWQMDKLVLSLQRESIWAQSPGRQYRNNLAGWLRQPMLWMTAAFLLAAGLTLPDLNTALLGGASEIRSAFLLLVALILGCWSSLKSLRVQGLTTSLLLTTMMLVGGFLGSTVLFTVGDTLLRSLLNTQSLLLPLFLFGATILLLGNLIAFLFVTSSRRIQNVQISHRK